MGIFGKPPETKTPEPGPPRPQPPAVAAPAVAAPRAGATTTTTSTTCVVGAKTTLKGELTGDEDVLVEGTVEGQVRISRDLRIGPGGRVNATVEAQSIIVSGEVNGDCTAHARVEIQATGRLTGNIRAPRIVIAEGAMFKGNSDMSPRKDEPKGKPAAS